MKRLLTAILLLFNGISACYGGFHLIADPSGKSLMLDSGWLANSPFQSYLMPGYILLLVIGIGSLITAFMVIFFVNSYPYAVIASGLALAIWIIAQYMLISAASVMQIIFGILGIAHVALKAFVTSLSRSITKERGAQITPLFL